MAVDPRLEAARKLLAQQAARQQARPLGVQFSPLQQFTPRPQAPAPASREAKLAAFNAAHGVDKKEDKGIFDGGLGGVLGKVGDGALLGLKAMGVPLRAVLATGEQMHEGITGQTDDTTMMDRVRDERFGFGDFVDTGNSTLDRALGFAGDVAFDPLTYATFGTGKLAGGAGRLATAAEMAAKGAAPETITQAARLGISSFDDVAREALNVGGHGLRVGTKGHNAVVPGTRRLAQEVGTNLNRAGAAIGDTKLGQAVSGLRMDDELAQAIRIVKGREPGDVKAAALKIYGNDFDRMGRGVVVNQFGGKARQWDSLSEGARRELTHMVEDPSVVDGLGGTEFYDDLLKAAHEGGASGITERANYVPHIRTDEFRKLAAENDDVARLFPVNTGESSGAAFARVLEPGGTYKFGDQSVTLGDASIRDINDKIGGLLGVKVLEDDFAKLAYQAVERTAADVGRARALKAIHEVAPDYVPRVDFSDGVRGLDQFGTREVLDEKATKAAVQGFRGESRENVNALTAQLRDISTASRGDLRSAKDAALRFETRNTPSGVGVLDEAVQAVTPNVDDVVADGATLPDVVVSIKSLKTGTHATKAELKHTADQLDRFISTNDLSDPDVAATAGLLADYATKLADRDGTVWALDAQRRFRDDMINGGGHNIMKELVDDGFERIGRQLFSDADGMVAKRELAKHYRQLMEGTKDGKWVHMLDTYTRFFKTFATMTPGFHFRNAMSATFMNFSDGVGLSDMVKAVDLWKQFKKDPHTFLAAADEDTLKAFRATFGSGAGGQFSVEELAKGKLSNIPPARLSKWAGEWVEGPARLAMALNTVKGKGSELEALARITRIHFDYGQLSKFDKKMKRIIPFWTFMSRNLPLQMQQIWAKPKAYAHYNAFKNNFDQTEEGDVIPAWLKDQGAIKIADNLMLAPDLPHVRLQEEIAKFTDPKKFLANANPLLRVPAETAVFNQQLYKDREFYPDENKWLYAALNMLPMVAQAERLSGGAISNAVQGEPTPGRQERQGTAVLNYLGLPLQKLTPQQLQAELKRLSGQ